MHLHVEEEADIPALAADTRNQAATAIIAICADCMQAARLGTALMQRSFGLPTRGHGEKGRSPPGEYQVKYLCVISGPIVIAGRDGIVKDIRPDVEKDTPERGKLFIAQLDFKVSIEDSLHMRVAGIAANSAVAERPEGLAFWNATVQELLDKSVRVLVFKDSAEHFREALRQKMQNTQISNVCGRGPSFFVLGPVDGVSAKDPARRKNMFTFHTGEGLDMTSNWSSIGLVKLKDSHTEIEKTKCTFVFVGSSTPRRSPAKFLERKVKRQAKKKWFRSA